MKTWLVDIAFSFSLCSHSDRLTNKEIKTCLVRRLTAGGIKASYLRVMKDKPRKATFTDLSHYPD